MQARDLNEEAGEEGLERRNKQLRGERLRGEQERAERAEARLASSSCYAPSGTTSARQTEGSRTLCQSGSPERLTFLR